MRSTKNLQCEASTMDDLQFRRSMYADPKTTDEDVRNALKDAPSKQKFAQELEALDAKLSEALKVPVPDDLYNNLILRQTLASHQQQKKKTRVHLAMAASVAFALGLTLNFMLFSSAHSNLGDYALAHVYHEEGLLKNNGNAKVTLTSLNQKMATFDGSFSKKVGELISAEFCRFDGMNSLHLVFQGKSSPVTVFIVPKNDHLDFAESFGDDTLKGASAKFEQADIIVIGDKNESLEQWQTNINDNVQWSI